MLIVQVCVGSSCHLKGSQDIVELFEKAIEEHHIEDEVVLSGSFWRRAVPVVFWNGDL